MNRLTIEQETEALHNAASRVGLGSHIVYMERKSDAHTHAEKIMLNSYHKGMAYKSSYLFCDTVDACFYFDHDGRASVTLSAQWCNGARDLGKPIKDAFGYIQKMLDAMTDETYKWLHGGMDERN